MQSMTYAYVPDDDNVMHSMTYVLLRPTHHNGNLTAKTLALTLGNENEQTTKTT